MKNGLLWFMCVFLLSGCVTERYVYKHVEIPNQLLIVKTEKPKVPKPTNGRILQSDIAIYIIELNSWANELNARLKAIELWNSSIEKK